MNARHRGAGYRVNVAARAVAAIAGGYALAALGALAAARAWPVDRLQASIAATILAFLVLPAVALWAFLAASPLRAWAGVLLAAVLLGAIGVAMGPRA